MQCESVPCRAAVFTTHESCSYLSESMGIWFYSLMIKPMLEPLAIPPGLSGMLTSSAYNIGLSVNIAACLQPQR